MLAALCLLSVLTTASPVVIEPFSDGPIRVESVDVGVARIYNDTQAHVSAEIRTLDSPGTVIQAHAQSAFDAVDKGMIGPQGGAATLYFANTVDLPLNNRNTLITILTPGVQGLDSLSAEEEAVVQRIWQRSMTDQVILPFITSIVGSPSFTSGKKQAVQAVISAFLSQNHQLYDDWKRADGATDYFRSVYNAVMRDVDSGGPLTTGLYKVTGMKFGEKVTEWVLKRTVLRNIPYANVADFALQVWNWGPTITGILNFIHDARTLPKKLTFAAYYKPGASHFEPSGIRTDGQDTKLIVHGYRLHDTRFSHRLILKRTSGSSLFVSSTSLASSDGKTLEFNIPGSAILSENGFLNVALELGDDTIEFVDQIQLTNVIRITGISPTVGRPGDRISIKGIGLSPFESTNKVIFKAGSTRSEAKIFVAGEERIEFEVPAIAESPEKWQVVVEESKTGSRRDSDPIEFNRLPGTKESVDELTARSEAPERSWTFNGTLTAEKPKALYNLEVPAGMEIEFELLEISGGLLKQANLGIRKIVPGAEPASISVGKIENINRVYGALKSIRHTTSSSYGVNTYHVFFEKGPGANVDYKARAKYVRRGDASFRDASDLSAQPTPIPVGVRVNASLHGAPKIWHEDRKDYFIVSSIPQSQRLTIKLGGVKGVDGEPASIGYVAVHRRRGNRWELNGYRQSITDRTTAIELRQDDVEVRDCLIEVSHGSGRPNYWLQADVDHISGPELNKTPIRSTFDEGTEDNWLISGNFKAEPEKAVHRETTGGGYVTSRDPATLRNGPLDLVFVIDTTGSMKSVIGQVTQSAAKIVSEVSQRCTSLRVGIIGYKDQQADGAATIKSVALSPQVDASLKTLNSWGTSGGGDDGPEDMLYGLAVAQNLNWRSQDEQGRPVAKVVVLMTDQPAKLSGGADFAGRTVSSVGASFERANIRVFPIITSSDSTAMAQARTLAIATGGQSHSETNVQFISGIITELVDQAMETISPRYYLSPAKFSGDMSRFYGRMLAFKIKSSPGKFRINEPDIILKGAGRQISITTFPTPEYSANSNGFNQIVVCLAETTHWYTSPNVRASASDIKTVLANLDSVMIRGEYFSGADDSALDEVFLGVSDGITDRGLTPFADEILRSMDQSLDLMIGLKEVYEISWARPVGLFQKALAQAGVQDASRVAILYSTDLSNPLFGILQGYPDTKLFDREIAQVRANMITIRLNGDVSIAESQQLQAGSIRWIEALDTIKSSMEAVLDNLVERERNRDIVLSGRAGVSATVQAVRLQNAAQEKIRELESKIKDAVEKPLLYAVPKH